MKMLCIGHTEMFTGTTDYYTVDGEAPEKLHFTEKNIADETAAQLARFMNGKNIGSKDIERIDVVVGADHGKGAFQAGAKVIVTTKHNANDKVEMKSHTFEISVAEVICKKDNAKVLQLTCNKRLTAGLKTIARSDLVVQEDVTGYITCSFLPATTNLPESDTTTSIRTRANLYVTGDLAFYGMVLGRESMMGNWCYLCHLSHSEFSELTKDGKDWTNEDLLEISA